MTDQAAVASLLAALTQRAQQQQQQVPVQGYPQYEYQPQTPIQYPAGIPQAQLPEALAQYGAYQSQNNSVTQNATNAALAAVAAATSSYNLPAPTNTGYLDLATLLKPDSSSMSIGEYYNRSNHSDSRSYDDRQYDEDRGRHDRNDRDRDDRDRDRDRGNRDRSGRGDDRRRKRSPTPPRLGDDERCRACSPKRDYSPGGTKTESVIVKTPFVGLVIGRGGETLKRLEGNSGARVQFITNGKEGPERVCNISGTADQVRIAKNEIIYMIEHAVLDSRGRPLQNGSGR
ncbi:hypothetical protein V1512DRAFT_257093 [Lipomyces arxii]|uniref:uncharacterized protein n=1 Tax=Lipomyces arxii TaxID=56418 RepID=UPI0034CDC399